MLERVRANGTAAAAERSGAAPPRARGPLTTALVACFLNEQEHLPMTRSVRRPRVLGGASYVIGRPAAGLRRAPRAPAPVRAFGRREQQVRARAALTGRTVR